MCKKLFGKKYQVHLHLITLPLTQTISNSLHLHQENG